MRKRLLWFKRRSQGKVILILIVLALGVGLVSFSWYISRPTEVKARSLTEIVTDIKNFEETHKNEPISPKNLNYLGERVKELYLAKFGEPLKRVRFAFISHQEFRNKSDRWGGLSPHTAGVAKPVKVTLLRGGMKIKEDNKIYIDREFPDIKWKNTQNHLSIFRVLMTHEFVHSQAILKPFADPLPKLLVNGQAWSLLYTRGFKTLAVDEKNQSLPIFRQLDESVTQFLANSLNNSIDGTQTVNMAVGQVVTKEDAKGAEVLTKLFRKLKISPSEVANFHRDSDDEDFLNFLRKKAIGTSLSEKLRGEDVAQVIPELLEKREFSKLLRLIN